MRGEGDREGKMCKNRLNWCDKPKKKICDDRWERGMDWIYTVTISLFHFNLDLDFSHVITISDTVHMSLL